LLPPDSAEFLGSFVSFLREARLVDLLDVNSPFWELVPSTPPEPVNSKNKLARALTGLPARKVASLALHP
tara:strand:+ start:1479 stop:1688 length:210 start_codon:yes stop_codon:yes gene_type:complete